MDPPGSTQGDTSPVATPVATPDMCYHCFDVLLRELIPETAFRRRRSGRRQSRRARTSVSGDVGDDDDDEIGISDDDVNVLADWLESLPLYAPPPVDCPLFVTWSKLCSPRDRHPLLLPEPSSSGTNTPASTTASSNIASDDEASSAHDDSDYELRGCIGTLSPRPLDRALSEFAVASALHDQRFHPVALHELPYLRAGVSLLVDYEECRDCLDWEVGVHGIILKLDAPPPSRGRHSATYLPEVAAEQGWTQREAVASLVRKAGYRGAVTDALLASARCTRYRSSKCRAGYGEYLRARHGGEDPLRDAGAAGATRQGARGARPCVNL